MADVTPILLRYSPILKDRLYEMAVGDTAELLDQDDLRGPIASIAIKASVEAEDPFQRLNIASRIGLTETVTASGLIVRDTRDNLAENNIGLNFTRPFRKVGHNVLSFAHTDFHDSASTVVTPILLGQEWAVNSSLKDFRYDEMSDITGVAHILDQHIAALRALVRSIGSYYDDGITSPHNFLVNFPDYLSGNNEKDTEHPDGFEAFVGIDHIISELNDIVEIANTPDKELRQFGIERVQGVLLHGPSGVGKTALAHAFAHELGAELVEIDLTEVQDVYIGVWATNLGKAFENAYESDQRVLLFFDEADGLFATGNRNSTRNITATLKHQLEKMKNYPNVYFIAATNNLDDIDINVRASKRVVTLPIAMPLPTQRAEIFRKLLIDARPQARAYDDLSALDTLDTLQETFDFNTLAELTEELSAGEIKEIIGRVNRQNYLAAKREKTEPQLPTQDQIIHAITWAKQRKN